MPTLIKKRGISRYRGNVQVNGIQRQKLFPDDSKMSLKTAVLWEAKTKKEMEKEGSMTPIISLTVLDWANKYLGSVEKRMVKKTFLAKRLAFSNLIKSVGPGMHANDLDSETALMHLEKQMIERSSNAANRDRKELSVAWNWGKKFLKGFSTEDINPFHNVDKFPEERRARYVPSEDDFWKVYDIASGQDRAMLLTFFYLAARRGEIFRMRWDDVDFKNNKIRLWTRKRKNGNLEFDWLPMREELKECLIDWWENRPIKDVDNVFVCLGGMKCQQNYFGKPFTERRRFMKSICKQAKVRHFGFHAIRHIMATKLYHSGRNLSQLQRFLRHTSPKTTEIYLKSLGFEMLARDIEGSWERPEEKIKSIQ